MKTHECIWVIWGPLENTLLANKYQYYNFFFSHTPGHLHPHSSYDSKTSFRLPTTTSAFQLTITSLICPIGFIFWINTCHIDITIDILVINMIQIMLHIMLNHDDGQSYQISLIVFIMLYMCCHLTKWWKFKSQGQNQHDWHWDRHHRCVENQW